MEKVKQSMKEKVPEIKRSLELVKHLLERQVWCCSCFSQRLVFGIRLSAANHVRRHNGFSTAVGRD